jgi:hypothetical protein
LARRIGASLIVAVALAVALVPAGLRAIGSQRLLAQACRLAAVLRLLRHTQIAASATGPKSGAGGSVVVRAGALTIEGGAQIASTTAGPGKAATSPQQLRMA